MHLWPMAVMAGLLVLSVSADAAEPPPGASSCSGCHGISSTGAAVPVLRGRPAAEIASIMRAFKSGARPATVMGRIAKGFSDPEIDAFGTWTSGRGP